MQHPQQHLAVFSFWFLSSMKVLLVSGGAASFFLVGVLFSDSFDFDFDLDFFTLCCCLVCLLGEQFVEMLVLSGLLAVVCLCGEPEFVGEEGFSTRRSVTSVG